MADTKISDLPAVSTVASTDQFVVNQGGTSKKETRAQVHELVSGEHFKLPQVDEGSTPTLAFGDGNTGFYEGLDNRLVLSTGGTMICQWDENQNIKFANKVYGSNTSSATLLNEAAAANNATVCPSLADQDTGIGLHSNDNLSIVCGAAEAARFEDPADLSSGETSLYVYDKDNDTVEPVKVGAADSGGSGYKVLRIAN